MQGVGHRPWTPGPSRRPEPLARAELGQLQPCVQRTNNLLRLSTGPRPTGSFQQVSTPPALLCTLRPEVGDAC